MKKIMILAGESSGDLHGAYLVEEIKRRFPQSYIYALGGELMRKKNVEIIADITNESIIGILEAVKLIPRLFFIFRELREFIRIKKPELIILIDFPEFNLYLAKFAKKLKIPVIYYLPPTIWAWREKRALRIKKYVNEVLSIFHFEEKIYKRYKIKVTFIGHPLIDIVKIKNTREEIIKNYGLEREREFIGLLPGSRLGELRRHLPILLSVARLIKVKSKDKDISFILPLAKTLSIEEIKKIESEDNLKSLDIKIFSPDNCYELMSICKLLIVSSGSATLEAMLLNIPMVVIYKLGLISYILGKIWVKLKYFSLPNIVAGKEIVPELFQKKADPNSIYKEVEKLLNNERILNIQKREMLNARENLGNEGVIKRAVDIIEGYLR